MRLRSRQSHGSERLVVPSDDEEIVFVKDLFADIRRAHGDEVALSPRLR